jgi:hypothetical protein
VVAGVVLLVVVVWFFFLSTAIDPSAGLSCEQNPLYISCPSTAIPIGSVMSIGPASEGCSGGGTGSATVCTYEFSIAIPGYASPVPSAKDLAFSLARVAANGSYSFSDSRFSNVMLVSSSGCTVGVWNASEASWGPASLPSQCPSRTVSSPVQPGDALVLTPIPSSSLSLSHGGWGFFVTGTGPSFTGWVISWIE